MGEAEGEGPVGEGEVVFGDGVQGEVQEGVGGGGQGGGFEVLDENVVADVCEHAAHLEAVD